MQLSQTSRAEPSGKGPSTVNKYMLICQRKAVTSCSGPPRPQHNVHSTAASHKREPKVLMQKQIY